MNTNTPSHTLDELIRVPEAVHQKHQHPLASHGGGSVSHRIDAVESPAQNSISNESPGTLRSPHGACDDPTFTMESPFCPRLRSGTLESVEPRTSLSVKSWPLMGLSGDSPHLGFPQDDQDGHFVPLLDITTAKKAEDYSRNKVQGHLALESWSDEQLFQHLRDTDFSPEMTVLLDEMIKRRSEIPNGPNTVFRDFAAYEKEQYSQSTFEVYEVGHNNIPFKLSADGNGDEPSSDTSDGQLENSADSVDAPTVWQTIRSVNANNHSVGRITIVQEPTPLILATLHLTMSKHFDMTELLTHLLSDEPNRGRTRAFMNRAYERPPSQSIPTSLPAGLSTSLPNVRQKSFFFVFKYYTVVNPPLEPASWQRFDKRDSESRLGDHIDIAECGSVLALSLGGEPEKAPTWRLRRERPREGFVFNTFGPWQLLAIQSFPDNSHTVRGEEFTKENNKYVNGPHAFLELLISEYRDATKRNLILHERITKLITPPPEFMFDPKLRDKLLFEDRHFTFIRRYFWSYNTLAVVNTGIKSMIAAYVDTFTDSFWAGNHPILWPHRYPDTPDGVAYRERMATVRAELDKVVQELTEVLKRNERTRKEIENLRDQLFSGSSIKESRRAIEQGDNIRILTMISMIFLPLTFVTSVFGMTVFTIPATDWRFALTMILVCVPFMLLITFLQTRSFGVLLRKLGATGSAVARAFNHLRRHARDSADVSDNRSIVAVAPRINSGICSLRMPTLPRERIGDLEKGGVGECSM
ncbi:cora-like Mg2+ transporter protein-domain-containing protein [Fusarium venenatum]|uniref:cora-like Mg2+ transporter protein-domain-containing protein n=1 Tax=Fusarium venenatum TaxID=56646 RepID=UPI001DB014B6|nr:cora-like Mg2+ transporter protein-domain-containing protein [Fusarium venenatum]